MNDSSSRLVVVRAYFEIVMSNGGKLVVTLLGREEVAFDTAGSENRNQLVSQRSATDQFTHGARGCYFASETCLLMVCQRSLVVDKPMLPHFSYSSG